MKPSFELRVGFRAEFTNGWNEAHGRASNYLFDPNGVILTQPVVGDSNIHRQSRKVPAGATYWICLVAIWLKKDGDPRRIRIVLRAVGQFKATVSIRTVPSIPSSQ